mgnify:FL=1
MGPAGIEAGRGVAGRTRGGVAGRRGRGGARLVLNLFRLDRLLMNKSEKSE